MRCVEVQIVKGRGDCHISASSHHSERILLVNLLHLRGGLRLRFARFCQPLHTTMRGSSKRTSSNAIRFWINNAIRESRYLTSFSKTKFFFDCEEIFDLRSRSIFWAVPGVRRPIRECQSERVLPFARSSSISKSFSFADIDKYNVVIEYRLDCRTERPPSWEDIVFCRDTG